MSVKQQSIDDSNKFPFRITKKGGLSHKKNQIKKGRAK